MELGCHAVLVGTAIAEARDPEVMAEAMRHAVEGGARRLQGRPHRPAPPSERVRFPGFSLLSRSSSSRSGSREEPT